MGVLRFKEDVEEILEKDPYELFQIETPHRMGRKLSPGALGAAALGVALAFGIAAVAFWNARRPATAGGDTPYAYFEVRALDPDGRPVAGAVVKEAGQAVGVTDSFGEWRRFMRVKPGATVMLEIAKSIGQTTLSATKAMAVPPTMPADGDLELTGSVQLVRNGDTASAVKSSEKKAKARAAIAAAEGDPRAAMKELAAQVDAEIAAVEKTIQRENAELARRKAEGEGAAISGRAAPFVADGGADAEMGDVPTQPVAAGEDAASEDETAGGGRALDGASIWIVVEDKGQFAPLTEVGAALKRRARELGARLDPKSPMRVIVRDLVAPGTGEDGLAHLVQVTAEVARDGGSSETMFSYLRNYQDDATATARDVLWAATMHAPVAHEVEKVGKDWLIGAPTARLWALTPGRLLQRTDGELIPVVATAGDQQTLKLLLGDDEAPCAAGAERCALVTPGIARVAPIPGWRRLTLNLHGVVGDGNGDLKVYVSGFAATPVAGQRGAYSYWGQPGGSANLTVLREGRVALRSRLAASAKGQASATMPFGPVATRR